MRWGLLLFFGVACQNDDPCFGQRDLVTSPGGLALVQEEHEVGWGQSECFMCHQAATLHTQQCSSADIDVTAIEVDVDDTTSCILCHGDNGVDEWASAGDTGE